MNRIGNKWRGLLNVSKHIQQTQQKITKLGRATRNSSFLFFQGVFGQVLCKIGVVFLVTIFLFGDLANVVPLMPKVPKAEAAEVVVASSPNSGGTSHIHTGPQSVFISDDIGYKFFRDSVGECSYVKTTNGGASWGSPVNVDDQAAQTDCNSISVHYDPWTPGDAGGYIHILTMDQGDDDLFYNRLDTSNDTLLMGSTALNITANAGFSGTLALGANRPTITKATDGTLFAAVDDASDSIVVRCSSACNVGTNWTEAGTSPQDLVNDWSLLVPLTGGDVLLINRDLSANSVRSQVWHNSSSSWDGSWTDVDTNAPENGTYDVAMAAVTASDGSVYLAYIAQANTLGTNDDIRSAVYNGSWTNTTDMVTDSALGLTQIAMALDANTDNVYVAYTGRSVPATADTADVYWNSSTNAMSSWGSETGPINTSSGDLWGVDLNNYSDERIYATWFDATAVNIYGDTIADVFGGVTVSATGTQISEVRAGDTGVHLGGSFVFNENIATRTVSSITLTESGTINGDTGVDNIRLYYEYDTSSPYNCESESYNATESQFGSTDTGGFTGDGGTASFTQSGVEISTTSALCVYVTLDILNEETDTKTLSVDIANPSSDVVISSGTVVPNTLVSPSGNTTVRDFVLTQQHFHFRNDDGNESGATSRTNGSEDTNLSALQTETPFRLRFGVSNEGSTSSDATSFRIEYAEAAGNCSLASGWVDIDTADDDFSMYDSSNLTNGTDSTDISIGIGGVTNGNSVHLSPNGALLDTTSQTTGLVLDTNNFLELEYSLVASSSAAEGTTYCFRLTDAGTELRAYDIYARATIAADVTLSATGTQVSNINIPATDQYIGGTFVIKENSSSRQLTDVTITESGSVDASVGLSNIKLFYDLDITNPYTCDDQSYGGGEAQFGATDTNGFSGANGTSTFSDGVTASTTQSICLYTVFDVTDSALNGETVDISINSPDDDIVVTGGAAVAPSTIVSLSGSTTLLGADLTQTHYHFRNDDGDEASATSATGGVEDTPLYGMKILDPVRLRLQVSNEGTNTSAPAGFTLEYGTKVTTCNNVGTWTRVSDTDAAFAMLDIANLTQGSDTTDVSAGLGGMTNENSSHLSPNGAQNDTSAVSATTTLTSSQFLELEYSFEITDKAGYDTNYCFRVSNNGVDLNNYIEYAELSTSPKQDFKIQRGTLFVSGTGSTITAGSEYDAPASTSTAFIRITNSHHTGAGKSSAGGNQNTDDVTAYISNPENLLTSITFTRPATALNDTKVDWEIIEYIGDGGADNEMVVRGQSTATFGINSTTMSGSAVAGVLDDDDVVVFITGIANPDVARADYETMQTTSNWASSTNQPTFERGASGSDAVVVSYAVVEFVGINWNIQRVEHTYSTAGDLELVDIPNPVISTTQAFLHTQKRMTNGLQTQADFGHEVFISGMGQLTFKIDSLATTPGGHTSVAWVIENTQVTTGAMNVHQVNGSTRGGTEPLTLSVDIGDTLERTSNSSIFANTRFSQIGTNFPRPIAGFRLASTTAFYLWRSDTGNTLTYRAEIVEWPIAELAFRQNYYRFYVDNDLITPTDPWPAGASDIGENTSISIADEPLGEGERVRVRMSLKVVNASLPQANQGFKLQFGLRSSTCSAINTWTDVGAPGSGVVWRGYNATPSDGTELPSLLLFSVSDVAGTFESANNSAINPNSATAGEDVEYDWLIEQNGAVQRADYCLRMVFGDGTPLSVYNNYPTLRSSGYTPLTSSWRWFTDENNLTPSSALAAENTAPIDVEDEILKLRVSLKETENAEGVNTKFGLQYSQSADFSDGGTFLTSTSSCTSTSTWCYADVAGSDNEIIDNSVISDSNACFAGIGNGCGAHNESTGGTSLVTQPALATTEFEFGIAQGLTRVNAVYYFRLWDMVNNEPVYASSSYPSLVTAGASLTFDILGLPAGTTTNSFTINATSTPSTLPFSVLPFNSVVYTGHRLAVNTNATDGYQVLMMTDQQLTDEYANTILPVTGTNASPLSWANGCSATTTSCFGYHVGDDVLQGGSARFAPDDTFAALATTASEIMYSAVPTNDTHDIVYGISVTEDNVPGEYQSNITYIAVPTF
ncbi:hypothetical protein KC845_01630 [Candidatus Kaiserbacteria bacterium]|nr:hypothetical protein [Candidatus Kaiserbacteria bacterium]